VTRRIDIILERFKFHVAYTIKLVYWEITGRSIGTTRGNLLLKVII
jgi:hypothetical protein